MRVTRSISIQLVVAISLMYGMRSPFAQTVNGSRPASCKTGNLQEESSRTVDKVTAFVDELTRAVGSDDKSRVARMMSYPLSIAIQSSRKRIHSEAEFIADYEQIVTPAMKALIVKQLPRCVSRVGAQGFSISRGELWFDEFPDGRIRIFAINSVVMPDE